MVLKPVVVRGLSLLLELLIDEILLERSQDSPSVEQQRESREDQDEESV